QPRDVVAATLDLFRSAIVEALLVMGAGLGLVGATSKIGVPANEAAREPQVDEKLAETEGAPAAPVETTVRRLTLPVATDEDMAVAVAVGPRGSVQAKTAPVEPEIPEAAPAPPESDLEPMIQNADTDEAMDPLLADALSKEQV